MYFEKNSHYGKQTFWEKRYAEYPFSQLETQPSSTGTRTGPTSETSSPNSSNTTAKSSTSAQVPLSKPRQLPLQLRNVRRRLQTYHQHRHLRNSRRRYATQIQNRKLRRIHAMYNMIEIDYYGDARNMVDF